MPRTMSAEEYQELGKKYYKGNEYQKAIDAFTEGIDSQSIPALGLLDNRAASYEKLEQYKSAVRDARDMIKIDKKDVRGYLRAGRILQKMEKQDAALGIYKYGIKNVPVTDVHFKLLQGTLDRLTRQLSPAKAVDPFRMLPVELVEMILSYLTFRNMVTCLRVSKEWKRFLSSRASLWMDLDLSHARKPVSGSFVRDAMRRSGHQLQRATIHRFAKVDVLRSLCTSCKDLRELEFLSGSVYGGDPLIEFSMCAKNLQKLLINVDISLDAVTQILKYRSTLKHAEFTSIDSANTPATWTTPQNSLHTLVLGCTQPLNTHHLDPNSLTAQTPQLRSLTFGNWRTDGGVLNGPLVYNFVDYRTLTHLEKLSLRLFDLGHFPLLPPGLTHLTLNPGRGGILSNGQFTNNREIGLACYNAQASNLSNLVHLDLNHIQNITDHFLTGLLLEHRLPNNDIVSIDAITAKPLAHLSLAEALIPDPTTLRTLLSNPRLGKLISIDLSAAPIGDDFVEILPGLLPNLQRVNLSKTRVTGYTIKILCSRLKDPGLRYLNVDFCSRISSEDAVKMARAMGVEVSWRMGEGRGAGLGRRVRY